ncbi:hypothetical protein [Sulfitobacter sp. 1A12157]|uniref:hypothetical protein n=1 Tax=Sulfitobacter sp. 1A12157 TaxID=3368594 RepID=UPI003747394F
MATRTVTNQQQLDSLIALLSERKQPFTVSITQGKKRSEDQNRTQRMWMLEAAEQLGTDTAEGFRGYAKLHFGIPILRAENEHFAAEYDAVIRPLPYEQKLRLMMVPFDFGVTRQMTTKQKTQYLDAVAAHFRGLGVVLTQPEDKQ